MFFFLWRIISCSIFFIFIIFCKISCTFIHFYLFFNLVSYSGSRFNLFCWNSYAHIVTYFNSLILCMYTLHCIVLLIIGNRFLRFTTSIFHVFFTLLYLIVLIYLPCNLFMFYVLPFMFLLFFLLYNKLMYYVVLLYDSWLRN